MGSEVEVGIVSVRPCYLLYILALSRFTSDLCPDKSPSGPLESGGWRLNDDRESGVETGSIS